jgi:hypothetical protein
MFDADLEEIGLKFQRYEYEKQQDLQTFPEDSAAAANTAFTEVQGTQSISLKEPVSRTAKCSSCFCNSVLAERQWASPKDAADLLGISTAILRSLAHARAIPVFVRPSGQRVYNLPSIRKYIAENTLQPLPTKV